ncbi:putative two component regulator sensor histidine kinase/response regulator fusion transcriptional regulator [uncultured Stenotrophomonas sp.]|uniref:histidine kinase n=1 Tax=uncultured Stenotrophomonas sp. TaxID=165438 RepID=A0A1Y5QCW3_9GAMM|nr:putative two component regulator sensor histidine kinase/response regulator fusion transcriptional regulator [uncultured Stenotrophomonas sp.]
MLSLVTVALAGVAWLVLMFGVALYGERRPAVFARHWRHVYALSLAVHCTSWTFYGTVTQAARYGWPLPPTFVGAILFYALAIGMMMRLVRLARETNATSLADLIAARLGRDAWLAATVTLIAALGLIPYIALQLKAVAMSFGMLTQRSADAVQSAAPWRDSALYVALAMALFAVLFGARRADVSEHNRGLVLAMAAESLFKLGAMLALGVFVWFGLKGIDLPAPQPVDAPAGGFMPLVLLGALAMFLLPHQFHIGVVECRDPADIRTARWLFPLYLLLIALPILPLARAGGALLGTSVPSDMYTLALPFSAGHTGVALFAFLGGLSAATGMVVVSTLTLSLMIGNHWFAPGLLRSTWARAGGDHRRELVWLRRVGICVIMLLAWAYSRLIGGGNVLADIGGISFSAMATLVPVLGFAIWRPQTPPRAAIAGLLAGFATWAWVLLLPSLLQGNGLAPGWQVEGPFGWRWLAPDALFGLTGWSPLGRAVGASLFVGTAVTLLAMAWRRDTPDRARRNLDADALRDAGRRFLPYEKVQHLLADAPRHGPVPARIEASIERELSAVLGAASARLLLDAARREEGELATVAAIVSEASQDLRFNQQVLQAALQNMSQGISVIDREQRLVAWNRPYAQLFGFPDELLQVGRPIIDLTRWALQAMPERGGDERAVDRRLAFMRAGTPHLTERVFPDGRIVEIRGNPMPGGGFVATFTDVTEFRRNEQALKRSNETLEQRVDERTALLESAKREAERANDAKSRFLTAIGHDLLQPLHAAHLFTDTLAQQVEAPPQQQAVMQIRGALDSTTQLLTGLFDMSRLEAGGLVPQSRDMPLAEVLDPLASEFRALAAARGLAFHYVPTRAWADSDPQLLRRVLQNFLANAVRYTARGGVLLGVRRAGGRVRIEVHDTGPGIARSEQRRIFEEFRRGEDSSGQGLGLGLAIADRIAGLLQAPLRLRSEPGRGTVFSVSLATVPAPVEAVPPTLAMAEPAATPVATRVLVVDNDPAALAGLAALLRGWGYEVAEAGGDAGAVAAMQAAPAALWLFDYNLDDGDTGTALHARLTGRFGARPTLILSADDSLATRREVLEQGLTLLHKPVRPLALKSILDRLLVARAAAKAPPG